MSHNPGEVQYTPYGPDRFAEHLPFARRGYLFTLPGSFPAITPAHTNVSDWEMAVYRVCGGWEVRDVNGDRKVWGTDPTRRGAVAMAYCEVYCVRRDRAAGIAEQRVTVLGLEPVPPYAVETTGNVTLALTPDVVGVANLINPADTLDAAASYLVFNLKTGQCESVPADGQVVLHTVQAGVFHHGCDCNPDNATHFETEFDAVAYARNSLVICWPCMAGH